MQQSSGSATMVETATTPSVVRNMSHSSAIPETRRENKHNSVATPSLQTLEAPVSKQSADSVSSSGSRGVSPTDQDSDGAAETAGDLQFKKKDFHKSRTQSFQSVLSSASLKSLKHQFTVPSQPQLKRNPSTISQTNTRNFQSFIQAPVLSSVSNLRASDDVEIGQRLPFDQSLQKDGSETPALRSSLADPTAANNSDQKNKNNTNNDNDDTDVSEEEEEDEDIYKEETTLQQQRLTLNALKKLSLSLAPIIRDDDDQGPQSRQLTTKSLNSAPKQPTARSEKKQSRDLRPVLRSSSSSRRSKPYQPAEVDLSSFSSLTRQSKHNSESSVAASTTNPPLPPPPPPTASSQDARQRAEAQIMQPSQAQVARVSHSQLPTETLPPAKPQFSTQTQASSQTSSISRRDPISSDMRSSGSENSAILHAHSAKSIENEAVDGLQKAFNNSVTVSPENNTPQILNTKKSQNFMRPAQISANLNQRDMIGRSQGQGSEISHGSSFGSSKSNVPDKRLQQINGFRSPMYIPAVLRKTVDETLDLGDSDSRAEYHVNSADSKVRETGSSANSVKSVDSAYSIDPITSPRLMTGPYELNKRQYDYILRAAPTRKHWVKDESVIECGIDACHKKFSFFERRHHCRKCGGIFCKEHTSHYLYINHLAQFTTGGRGTLSRVCDNCIKEYNEFMKHEFGVTCHRPSSRESLPQQSALNKIDYRKEIFTSKMTGSIPMKSADSSDDNKTADQLVGSVPVNWSWSSF